ncbi:phosphinothricin acetyltransferase [Chitinophaga skermanii]|uniref:Phosphinothricin acetyltransferase n=1 Tax=Chitinophaga skermanii TaxID=331697 RepID=A0A327Q651_9BACT|nr:GNAT family N-acetyltransferase [Chitinophaga skermanii]RAI99363.1 phosphinothricin acetyltransferase [Chitinophaga skermanii]
MKSEPVIYRNATIDDLPEIVAIYNTIVAGRMVTADTEEISVESRVKWFHDHNPQTRPLLMIHTPSGETVGWVSFSSFYGRPAYNGTAEISIYLSEAQRGKGYGKIVLQDMMKAAPQYDIKTILAFIFAHNEPSMKLFLQNGFAEYGHFPNVAVLDGVERTLMILGYKTQA